MTDTTDQTVNTLTVDPLLSATVAYENLLDADDADTGTYLAQQTIAAALISIAADLRRLISDDARIHTCDCIHGPGRDADEDMPEAEQSERDW